MYEQRFHSIARVLLWLLRWRKFKINIYYPGGLKLAARHEWRPRIWWALLGAYEFTHMYMINSRAMHVPQLKQEFLDLCDQLGGRKMIYEFEGDPTRMIVFLESGDLEVIARLNAKHALYLVMVEFVDSRV